LHARAAARGPRDPAGALARRRNQGVDMATSLIVCTSFYAALALFAGGRRLARRGVPRGIRS